jgi:hypothetical protein
VLNVCADVPPSSVPEICKSLISTVGYKTYYIGERQVRLACGPRLRPRPFPPCHLALAHHPSRRCAQIWDSISSATGP